MKLKPHEEIYAAKNKILENRRLMIMAATHSEYGEVGRLRRESDQLRADILRKYGILIDY